jgi:hypothetical protein
VIDHLQHSDEDAANRVTCYVIFAIAVGLCIALLVYATLFL